MNKVLVILGPTSTGKTDLALTLAKKFNGELVSCDSRQVYVGLDIGTGKMPGVDLRFKNKDLRIKKGNNWWEIGGIKIWMYDVISPKRQYTVFDYVKDANKAIDKIIKKGKQPIIVGGTGLYLKGLLYGFPNLGIPVDKKLRNNLEELTLEELQKNLQGFSIQRWEKMNSSDRQNPRRLVRAIELTISSLRGARRRSNPLNILPRPFGPRNDILKIGLTTSREILYKRIDERVVSRINEGMIDEAIRLYKDGLSLKRMRQLGLEYGVMADFLEIKISRDQLIETLKVKIHHFAKRQETWFKKEKDINWFDIAKKNYINKVENLVAKWYYQANATQD